MAREQERDRTSHSPGSPAAAYNLLPPIYHHRRLAACPPHVASLSPLRPRDTQAYLATRYGRHRPREYHHDHSTSHTPIRFLPHSLTPDGHLAAFGIEHHQIKYGQGKPKKHGVKGTVKRIMAAVAHPTRPQIRRNSPLSTINPSYGNRANAPVMKRPVADDSDSDDEPPPAIKFSKVTQALLADEGVPSSPPRQMQSSASRFTRSVSTGRAELDTPSRAPGIKIVRRSSPSVSGSQDQNERGHTPPRIVSLASKGNSASKRSISISGPYPHRAVGKREPTPETNIKSEVVTPAQAPRAIRVVTRSRAGSNASQDERSNFISSISRPGSRNGVRGASDAIEKKTSQSELSRSTSQQYAQETSSRYGPSTVARSRNTSAEAQAPPGSQRMKRIGTGTTGTFLKSGPVRRGFRRRDSDDNISPTDDAQNAVSSQPSASSYTPQERSLSQLDNGRSQSGSVNTRATSVEPVSVHDFAHRPSAQAGSRPSSRQANAPPSRSRMGSDSRPPSRQASRERSRDRQPSVERPQYRRQGSVPPVEAPAAVPFQQQRRPSIEPGHQRPALEQKPQPKATSFSRATYRYVPPKVHTDAADDQENMPPPTFRRNREQEFKYLGKPSMTVLSDDEKGKHGAVEETPVPVPQQGERKVLGAISGNTPHRAAPAPPPKMSVLDAATTTAGAGATKSRKKRQHMVVNGKIFTQMGKIGKGGSSDVYCVMAENYKTFALKRVKLDDCDENAVRGYKGEIDLLKKLTEVDRVVRLFDWELNEEKQELAVLMEKGDTDFNRILTLRLNGVDARFDATFARYYWKEMLECVQSVHDFDIVHSDLKPANFLVVQGRLKLIDFGIANAIDTDNTVNVHRDSHVGTPNYMSPESIRDTNSGAGKDEAGRPLKDMCIGKSSDVWSLGCILYQMTYGRPPFAHIQSQISRILAITDHKHPIEFPEKGVGGARIPPTLIGTLKRCLNREPARRPTIQEMLSDSDAFLNPDGFNCSSVAVNEELLGRILNKVLDRCRDPKQGGVPTSEEALVYARGFVAKIRETQQSEGRSA